MHTHTLTQMCTHSHTHTATRSRQNDLLCHARERLCVLFESDGIVIVCTQHHTNYTLRD